MYLLTQWSIQLQGFMALLCIGGTLSHAISVSVCEWGSWKTSVLSRWLNLKKKKKKSPHKYMLISDQQPCPKALGHDFFRGESHTVLK